MTSTSSLPFGVLYTDIRKICGSISMISGLHLILDNSMRRCDWKMNRSRRRKEKSVIISGIKTCMDEWESMPWWSMTLNWFFIFEQGKSLTHTLVLRTLLYMHPSLYCSSGSCENPIPSSSHILQEYLAKDSIQENPNKPGSCMAMLQRGSGNSWSERGHRLQLINSIIIEIEKKILHNKSNNLY